MPLPTDSVYRVKNIGGPNPRFCITKAACEVGVPIGREPGTDTIYTAVPLSEQQINAFRREGYELLIEQNPFSTR